MTKNKKLQLIEEIQIQIKEMQFISQEWQDEKMKEKLKQDIDSLRTILGHLLTLQTI